METDIQNIGNRRELFVDDYLTDRLVNCHAVLHQPQPREVALTCDKPWEGCMNAFNTVIAVHGHYRLYYRGWHIDLAGFDGATASRPATICLAESADGIHWERVPVGRFDYSGSRNNNIVWMGEGADAWGMHGFSPFQDTNPDCRPDERWKAVGGGWRESHHGLYLMGSPDGIAWRLLSDKPFLAGHPLDSHNTVLWSEAEGCYRAYFRHWSAGLYSGMRTIATATSPDLHTWSEAVPLAFPGAPDEQLYTNNILPYPRAPHLRLGFPARYVERPWSPTIDALPEPEHRRLRAKASPRYGSAVTDTVFMSGRDAVTFRRWGEAFIRPGCRPTGSWAYGDLFTSWGMAETDSELFAGTRELSFYASEGYWRGAGSAIRRYALRLDGFVSINAPLSGGSLVTKPCVFDGNRLSLNVSTSAAGSLRVELQDAAGDPFPGFALNDCWEIVGDSPNYTVNWRHGANVGSLAGRPVRMRFELKDADLFALRFQ